MEGDTLRAQIDREEQLPLDDAIRIATDVAEALDHAHGRRVVHRDIKPSNILLRDGRPLIADFGFARIVDRGVTERLTASGITIGTSGYMSPEQAAGDEKVDHRTDLYSLGCSPYEMLAGELPKNVLGSPRSKVMTHSSFSYRARSAPPVRLRYSPSMSCAKRRHAALHVPSNTVVPPLRRPH